MTHRIVGFENGAGEPELNPVYTKLSEMLLREEVRVGYDSPIDPDGGDFAVLEPAQTPPESEGAVAELPPTENRLGNLALSNV